MIKKATSIIFALILSIVTLAFISGCSQNNNKEGEQKMWHQFIPADKQIYLHDLFFRFSIYVDGERRTVNGLNVITAYVSWGSRTEITPLLPQLITVPELTELALVYNEEEAAGFPENVVVAWPWEHAQDIIDGMHWAVSLNVDDLVDSSTGWKIRDPIALEDFGLTYPLTVTDFVDNWEKMMTLWFAFESVERHSLVHFGTWGNTTQQPVNDITDINDSSVYETESPQNQDSQPPQLTVANVDNVYRHYVHNVLGITGASGQLVTDVINAYKSDECVEEAVERCRARNRAINQGPERPVEYSAART